MKSHKKLYNNYLVIISYIYKGYSWLSTRIYLEWATIQKMEGKPVRLCLLGMKWVNSLLVWTFEVGKHTPLLWIKDYDKKARISRTDDPPTHPPCSPPPPNNTAKDAVPGTENLANFSVPVTSWILENSQPSFCGFCYRKLLTVGFLSRDDSVINGQREVDLSVGYQVGLEFCQIDIQGSIKSEGSSDGRHNLTYQPV